MGDGRRPEALPDERIYELTTRNRLMIADVLEGLRDDQWRHDTLCRGWDVHTVAAHLLQPMLVGFGRLVLAALRHRGDTDLAVDRVTRRLARRDRTEIIGLLREHASDEVSPTRVGPMGPFAETCVHLRDIARPLGLAADVPTAHWTTLLDYLCAPGAAAALVPPGRLDGLRLEATDAAWSAGPGATLSGPVEALGMAVTGRPDALGELRGPGVALLRSRIA